MITTQNSVLSGAPTPQELELINSYTVKPLKAEEVYTFGIVLCDNEIDRDFERFDIPALEKLAGLFVGKTGIFDHRRRGYFPAASRRTKIKSPRRAKNIRSSAREPICRAARRMRRS